MGKKLTPSDITILISGAVLLIASFFDWDEFGNNAWDSFPLLVYPAIAGTIAAVHIVLTKLTGTSVPDQPLGFTWNQIHWLLAALAGLVVLGVLFLENFTDRAEFGFWLTLIATIGLIAGAAVRSREPVEAGTSQSG